MAGKSAKIKTERGFAIAIPLAVIGAVLAFLLVIVLFATGIYMWWSSRGEAAPTIGTVLSDSSLLFPTGHTDAEMAACIDSYITKNAPSSYLAGHGADFVSAGKTNNVNPALLVAIAKAESSIGLTGIANNGGYNYFGMTAAGGGNMTFSSVAEAINFQAGYMRRSYLNEGIDTIEKIQQKYSPVGAANDPFGTNVEWTGMVTSAMKGLRNMCPSLIGQNELSTTTISLSFDGKTALPIKESDVRKEGNGLMFNSTSHGRSISHPGARDGHNVVLTSSSSRFNTQIPPTTGEAIDLASYGEKPLYAVFDGKIVYTSSTELCGGTCGIFVVLESIDRNSVAVYAHLNPAKTLGTGTQVAVGQQIATLKSYSGAMGPHLHFELWINKVPVNAGQTFKPSQIWVNNKKALGF